MKVEKVSLGMLENTFKSTQTSLGCNNAWNISQVVWCHFNVVNLVRTPPTIVLILHSKTLTIQVTCKSFKPFNYVFTPMHTRKWEYSLWDAGT